MKKVLFLPFNTNHAMIFEAIIKSLNCSCEILCHDKISEGAQFHTEESLKQRGLSYIHFQNQILRSPDDNFIKKLIDFFKIKKQIKNILKSISPSLIIFAIDNDPIAQITIHEASRLGIKTLLVPEGLIQPYDLLKRKTYRSHHIYRMLRFFGIYLNYVKYGTAGCDHILISGKRAFNTLISIGVPENKMTIAGHQKYDSFLSKLSSIDPPNNKTKTYLFATSKRIFKDITEIRLLRKVINTMKELELNLIIKIHPRTPESPADLYNRIELNGNSTFEIIKEGYDTFEVLKKVDAIITIPSAIILEVLMLDKECLLVSYLEGESFEDYIQYDAIHFINSEQEISDVIRKSSIEKKQRENKIRLLKDELYMLDGKACRRTADFIGGLLSD